MKLIIPIIGLFFSINLMPVYGNEKLLSLVEADRKIVFEDKNTTEFYVCLTENKKVFGKNPAKTSECYSMIEQEISVSLDAFVAQSTDAESQIGFFTSEGKQVFPYWEENGFRYVIYTFVLNSNGKVYVQSIRKDNKQYFYLRTNSKDWSLYK